MTRNDENSFDEYGLAPTEAITAEHPNHRDDVVLEPLA
jgi:hypothetical protein